MKQNKSRKQTLESAQYGLEISFKGRKFSEVIRKKYNLQVCANYVQCKLTPRWAAGIFCRLQVEI